MSIVISASGYGYSKKLCTNVAVWYIRKHLLKYKFNLLIHHRSLRKDAVYGYCDTTERKKDFLIEMSTYLSKDLYIRTLLHEMVHLRQYLDKSLQFRSGQLFFRSERIDSMEYWEQPHEIEAHEQEKSLYEEYIKIRGPTFSKLT